MHRYFKIGFMLFLFIQLGLAAPLNFNKEDVCVIRKLKIYEHPHWAAQITLHSGKKVFTSSPKSMFEFIFKPKIYTDFNYTGKADIKELMVTDYTSLDAINATQAFYVYGSNIISPSGDDLVAFSSKSDAENFLKKHHGSRVFTFSQVSFALIKLLNGNI